MSNNNNVESMKLIIDGILHALKLKVIRRNLDSRWHINENTTYAISLLYNCSEFILGIHIPDIIYIREAPFMQYSLLLVKVYEPDLIDKLRKFIIDPTKYPTNNYTIGSDILEQ